MSSPFRVPFLLITAAALALLGPARAELGMDVMQTMEDVNKSLSSNLSLREAKGSLADANELEGLFAQVEAHFVARGDAANGVELSRQSRVLAKAIVTAVSAGKFDEATDAATQLSRTCRTCHTFYKKE